MDTDLQKAPQRTRAERRLRQRTPKPVKRHVLMPMAWRDLPFKMTRQPGQVAGRCPCGWLSIASSDEDHTGPEKLREAFAAHLEAR